MMSMLIGCWMEPSTLFFFPSKIDVRFSRTFWVCQRGKESTSQYLFIYLFIYLFKYLFFCEGGGAERGRENPKRALCCQHEDWSGAWSHKPWDHDLSGNQESCALVTEPPRHLVTILFLLFVSNNCMTDNLCDKN